MWGICLSKKFLIALICLLVVILAVSKKRKNTSLAEAEAILISKMSDNEKAVEVFNMEDGGLFT